MLRRLRSFKVIEVGTNRKPVCDFLLVINSQAKLVNASLSSATFPSSMKHAVVRPSVKKPVYRPVTAHHLPANIKPSIYF